MSIAQVAFSRPTGIQSTVPSCETTAIESNRFPSPSGSFMSKALKRGNWWKSPLYKIKRGTMKKFLIKKKQTKNYNYLLFPNSKGWWASSFWNKQKVILFYSCISMGKCLSTGRLVSPQEAQWRPCWYLGNDRQPIMQQINLLWCWMSWWYISIGWCWSASRRGWSAWTS